MAEGEFRFSVEKPRLLRDQVTDAVREAIMRGDLAPGRRLTERELVELTGVSRTSLREALRTLQAEGLVERAEGRGVRVAHVTPEMISELHDVRAPLEAAAAELCALHATDAQILALQKALPDPAAPFEERLETAREFYQLLMDVAGNSVLRQMFGVIEARVHAQRRVSLRSVGRSQTSNRELRQVVDFIAQRDASAAAAAAAAHVRAAKDAALAALGTAEAPNFAS